MDVHLKIKGYVKQSINVSVGSLNTYEKSDKLNDSQALLGGYLGLENDSYRLSVSYDINKNSTIKTQRYMLNFDYRFQDIQNYKPFLGFALGGAYNEYTIQNRKIEFSNAVFSVHSGFEYLYDDKNSIEVLLEYSLMSNQDNSFVTFDFKDQSMFLIRLGLKFTFF